MIDEIIKALSKAAENPTCEQSLLPFGQLVTEMPQDQTAQLFQQLVSFARNNDQCWTRPTTLLLGNLPNAKMKQWLPTGALPAIASLYEICPADQILRIQLLSMLANQGETDAIELWCKLICDNPPTTTGGLEAAFHPLAANPTALSEAQLNRLVENGTSQPVIASAIYELANHQFRSGTITTHPLNDRIQQLSDLLGSLVQRMATIEEGQLPEGTNPETVAQSVQDSVALIIALIDTLGLLQVDSALGKFNQAFELRHRRIQVEAAAALARLGEDGSKEKLLSMAIHPVVRPRVIAYAKELGIEKDISLEHTGPIADAETQLALWLSQPSQMGLAPTEIELIDQRELYWPSYEDPMSCYLFSFEYGTGENAYRNIGISGPLTHAFVADITELPIADQFSAFAGWQTMSDEIYLVPIERAQALLAGPTESLKRHFDSTELEEFAIEFVASFFGEYVLVIAGKRDQQDGTLIVHEEKQTWIPSTNSQSPIDSKLAFDIWSGRKLLTNFNPAFS